jgi:hypothetical protein
MQEGLPGRWPQVPRQALQDQMALREEEDWRKHKEAQMQEGLPSCGPQVPRPPLQDKMALREEEDWGKHKEA